MVIFVVDLETTGTDITKDWVVEIAAVHTHNDSKRSCESFATTIQVDANIVMELQVEAFKVHGITSEEIQQSPSFERHGADSRSGSWM